MSSNFRSVALENSLVETPNYNCRLEITVSHPRTKPFVRMSEDHQKKYYYGIYSNFIKEEIAKHFRYEDTYRYELSKDGNVHLHAYVDLFFSDEYSIRGLVESAAKRLVFAMPKRTHQQLVDHHYSTSYECWRMPAVLVQYQNLQDLNRKRDWESYIRKFD